LTVEFGNPSYTRIDAPATPEQKALLQKVSPEAALPLKPLNLALPFKAD
jgi:hypothetical protein